METKHIYGILKISFSTWMYSLPVCVCALMHEFYQFWHLHPINGKLDLVADGAVIFFLSFKKQNRDWITPLLLLFYTHIVHAFVNNLAAFMLVKRRLMHAEQLL